MIVASVAEALTSATNIKRPQDERGSNGEPRLLITLVRKD